LDNTLGNSVSSFASFLLLLFGTLSVMLWVMPLLLPMLLPITVGNIDGARLPCHRRYRHAFVFRIIC
jgi:hypothetical protein